MFDLSRQPCFNVVHRPVLMWDEGASHYQGAL